ncbi:MAG: hypothetical protein NVSMB2_02340 [Chloroflexota bacterium]
MDPASVGLINAVHAWQRRLLRAELARGAVRAAAAAALLAFGVQVLGGLSELDDSLLRLAAATAGLLLWLGGVTLAAWPLRTRHAVAALDRRLGLADRLTTAWTLRRVADPAANVQRRDALRALSHAADRHRPVAIWRTRRRDLIACAVSLALAMVATLSVHPRRTALDAQVAESAAVQGTAERLEMLRQNTTTATANLSPAAAAQIRSVLEEATLGVAAARTQREATAVLEHAEARLSSALADPNAQAREDALAAMSEALASETLTRPLAQALQHADPNAAHAALDALSQNAQRLTEPQRRDVSRALQRAANVGQGDAPTATALGQAARAFDRASAQSQGQGQGASQTQSQGADQPTDASPSTADALAAADAALTESLQAARTQATLQATAQGLQDIAANAPPLRTAPPRSSDATTASGPDTRQRSSGAGVQAAAPPDPASPLHAPASSTAGGAAVFVPSRAAGPSTDSAPVQETFSVRGEPRTYREALPEFAQAQRDYVERGDVPSADRDLVQRYFVDLGGGG